MANIPTYHLDPDFRFKLKTFVDRFTADGYDFFAKEFERVDEYIARAKANPSDETLRVTPKIKYLLELVAFQIYDRANREAFNAAPRTLIVMPDCLSLNNPDCEKIETKFGTVCKRCLPECQAYEIGELARRYRVKTIFSKRKLGEQLERYASKLGGFGVIGIACINMLADGMRTAADVGVPSRGVLLSFSGCEHWNDQPCSSEFSIEWLESILEEKHGRRSQKTDD